jgi:S-adenosylmethionine-diacylgycerolhomoserine-N-methlytransferase
MGIRSDLQVLYHLAVKRVGGKSHADRMENFYSGQAGAYDDFRKRLLQGRERLWQQLGNHPGGVWVDLGGGTGANLEFFAPQVLAQLKKIYVVDLAGSLLKVLEQRIAQHGWTNVVPVQADATTFQPPDGCADVVTFSYSLTMIPDWFAAIDNARTMLKPGGRIGVVDFYVSRKHAEQNRAQHGWGTRSFWPVWFASDNVFPSSEHLPYLQRNFQTVALEESRAKVPYLPFGRVPYYSFVGERP